MNVANPNDYKRKKAPAKPKGGEPFDAEPGALEPTQKWLDGQAALLKLTIKESDGYYGNSLPQLDGYSSHENSTEYEWDDERKSYFWRQYISWKVSYRYYRGNRKRSYIFWPKHVVPSYVAKKILRDNPGIGFIHVRTESGDAYYAYLGDINFHSTDVDQWGNKRRGTMVFALWRSSGTMKPRRTNKRRVTWEADARTSAYQNP